MRLSSCLVLLVLIVGAARASAQNQSTDAQIISAAAAHFAALLADSAIAVDPRIAARAHRSAAGTFEAEWPDTIVQLLRTRLSARSAYQLDVVRCATNHPGSCSIVGADVFMKFGRPQVQEGVATVYVNITVPGASARNPVAARQHELVLKAVDGAWRVVSDVVVAQS